MIKQITDTEVLQNYVSPHLCSDLKYAGYGCKAKFFWKIYEKDVILDTHIFDIDDYYKDAAGLLDKLNAPKQILPAFTIKEIERYLPDFCICRVNNSYELSIDHSYGVEAVRATRLPDVYAIMMLACLKKRVIDPKRCTV